MDLYFRSIIERTPSGERKCIRHNVYFGCLFDAKRNYIMTGEKDTCTTFSSNLDFFATVQIRSIKPYGHRSLSEVGVP